MPGYHVRNTTGGDENNPSAAGYLEFGTDKQAVRPIRLNSDGTISLGDGTAAPDTTLARAGAGVLTVNGQATGGVEYPLTTGESTSSRSTVTGGTNALISGTVALQFFTAGKTETITQVKAYTSNTAAAATPTLCRYGVYTETAGTGDLTLVASTANDTALWAATNTAYPKTLTAAWAKVAGTRYAVGLLIVTAVAAPAFMTSNPTGFTLASAIMAQPPQIYGASPAGLSDLPASITAAQIAASTRTVYVEVLP